MSHHARRSAAVRPHHGTPALFLYNQPAFAGYMWKSIYVAAPGIPAPVLRGIARYAGVHMYNAEPDVLYATRQLLGVHTLRGGERTFHLPQPVEVVYDLFEGRSIASNTREFQAVLPPASTSLYFTGDAGLLRSVGPSSSDTR